MMDRSRTDVLRRDLQRELVPGIVAALALTGLGVALADATPDIPPSPAFWGLLTLFGAPLLWWATTRYPRWGGEIISLGVALLTDLAWRWMAIPGLGYAFVLVVIIGSLVNGWRGAIGTVLASTLLLVAGHLRNGTFEQAPLVVWGHLIVLWLVGYLMLLGYRTERAIMTWAWHGYQQARDNLQVARARQVRLQEALEDLELVNREMGRLNDMLIASRQAVEDARMTKEAFVANVSHELRTPLNMIIGFSDEILERPDAYASHLPEDLLDDVAAIRRNSEHLAGLVDDILNLSEAEMGHMRLTYERANVRGIIDEAVQQVHLLFDRKGLALSIQTLANLPLIHCDRDRIRQVVLNILSNAGRFTERGGATVCAIRQNDMVQISVSDTGPGVRRDLLTRLFEPFQQADPSVRRKHGGTGLGLAISKRLVEMHGGRIWMESEVGLGSTVSFTLPVKPPQAPDPAIRWFSPHDDPTPRERSSRAPRVEAKPGLVIIEEGEILSQIAERHLERLAPLTAHTLPQARELVDAGSAVGVLLNAPSFDSEQIAHHLDGMRFDVPILSCWMPDLYSRRRDLNVREYLVKPILRTRMLETVQRIAPQARTVLLADDDPEARQLFGRMLAGLGGDHRIIMASDGEETLYHMRHDHPDIVLLDLIMPRKDGFAVLREKAADPSVSHIPVILISGRDPQREPIVSDRLSVRRLQGLSGRELIRSVEALTYALGPRFGARVERETRVP